MSTALVGPTAIVPTPSYVTIEEAYAEILALREEGVRYQIAIEDDDHYVLKRFSRSIPLEFWLVAWPVDNEGGRRRDKQMIVSVIAVDGRLPVARDTYEQMLRDELSRVAKEGTV